MKTTQTFITRRTFTLITLLLVFLLIISACKNENNPQLYTKTDSGSAIVNDPEKEATKINSSTIDFTLFEDAKTRNDYFINHKKEFPGKITLHYDKYDQIKSQDEIFEVFHELERTCKRENKIFYFYVFWKLVKNKNIDGYLAEAASGNAKEHFDNCTESFYDFLSFLDQNDHDSFLSIVSSLSFELTNSMSTEEIKALFNKHRNMYHSKGVIDKVEENVLNYNN